MFRLYWGKQGNFSLSPPCQGESVFLQRREAVASCWENYFNTKAWSNSGGNSTAWEASFQRAETLELRMRSP